MERLIIQDSDGRRAGAIDLQAVVGAHLQRTEGARINDGQTITVDYSWQVVIITDLPLGVIHDRRDRNRDVALARVDHILAAVDAGFDPDSHECEPGT